MDFPKEVVSVPWQHGFTCGVAIIVFSVIFSLAILSFLLAIRRRKVRQEGKTGSMDLDRTLASTSSGSGGSGSEGSGDGSSGSELGGGS